MKQSKYHIKFSPFSSVLHIWECKCFHSKFCLRLFCKMHKIFEENWNNKCSWHGNDRFPIKSNWNEMEVFTEKSWKGNAYFTFHYNSRNFCNTILGELVLSLLHFRFYIIYSFHPTYFYHEVTFSPTGQEKRLAFETLCHAKTNCFWFLS